MFVAGDRLLGVNGQCVRTVSEAEGLLGGSEEVVRLHLQRHESLPRPGLEPAVTMGSNISRHSGKGLTGRRTQSSGNLCNGKAPGVHRYCTVSYHWTKSCRLTLVEQQFIHVHFETFNEWSEHRLTQNIRNQKYWFRLQLRNQCTLNRLNAEWACAWPESGIYLEV